MKIELVEFTNGTFGIRKKFLWFEWFYSGLYWYRDYNSITSLCHLSLKAANDFYNDLITEDEEEDYTVNSVFKIIKRNY